MLGRLEYLAFLVADMRFEKLPESLHALAVEHLGGQQGAKLGVILADSTRESGLADRFERRDQMLLLDLKVRLQMAGESRADLLAKPLECRIGCRAVDLPAALCECEACVVVIREVAQLGYALHETSDSMLLSEPIIALPHSAGATPASISREIVSVRRRIIGSAV